MLSRNDQDVTDLNEINIEMVPATVIEKGKLKENDDYDDIDDDQNIRLSIEMEQIDSKREPTSDSNLAKD